ncbi:MAG: DegV family protein [Eubacteriales bacterium]|nr:DegV family protein [Eubacteriales bacterium]
MKKTAIATDSNSGITQTAAKELGVYVLPMPFTVDDQLFFEDITLTQEQFYEKLQSDASVITSQPSPADVTDLWDELLKNFDEVVYIPMSSGLSNSCETATMLSQSYEGKVFVVNNQRISVTQRRSVLDALKLVKEGKSGEEIKKVLEDMKLDSSIYITVDTLKYLKQGGRVTPAAAAIGTILNIKPVLQIQGEKLDSFAKARGFKQAKSIMLDAIENDMNQRFKGQNIRLDVAYTCTEDEAREWKQEVEARFPGYEIIMDKLSLSVACHIGPGSMAVACSKVL